MAFKVFVQQETAPGTQDFVESQIGNTFVSQVAALAFADNLSVYGATHRDSAGLEAIRIPAHKIDRLVIREDIPTGDQFFANVVLLLDFAGADAATDITDLSNSGHVDTFVGTAQVDTWRQILGTNSLLLDGDSDYIHFPDSSDWDFGTADFTIELHAFFDVTTGSKALISSFDAGGKGVGIQTAFGPVINFIGQGAQLMSETWAPVTSRWYHVAVARSGTDLRIFIDGEQLGTTTIDSTNITAGTKKMFFGVLRDDTATQHFEGSLAAVRVTKGIARYTANFAPPTEFYPTS